MSATARKLDYDDAEEVPSAVPESIILVREARRTRTHRHAAPVTRPRLLPAASPRRRAHLGIFAIVCLVIATVGLVSMLIVNTMLASGAFTVNQLQAEKALLLEQEQQLTEDIAIASSPMLLEERARGFGMVPQDAPAFIDLEAGTIVGNAVPQPAPIVVDPATGTYQNGYLIDPTTGEIYIDPYTGLPITEDGQPIGYDGEAVDGVSGEDPIRDPDTGQLVDPVTGQPLPGADPGQGEAEITGPEEDIIPEVIPETPIDEGAPAEPAPSGGPEVP
ncbi:MAG: hypothetical protein NWR17_02435 [Candidatus Nanopelagicales bacterium]|jgi:hypothetical protein|nr:hypothetical protein [Candidatus Nanopelagicales bacterium]